MHSQRLELLKPKMDSLFRVQEGWEAKGKDLNEHIQGGREFRNPRILEKLIESCKIKQYGTNYLDYQTKKIDPEAYYDSRRFKKMREDRAMEHHEMTNPKGGGSSSTTTTTTMSTTTTSTTQSNRQQHQPSRSLHDGPSSNQHSTSHHRHHHRQ